MKLLEMERRKEEELEKKRKEAEEADKFRETKRQDAEFISK